VRGCNIPRLLLGKAGFSAGSNLSLLYLTRHRYDMLGIATLFRMLAEVFFYRLLNPRGTQGLYTGAESLLELCLVEVPREVWLGQLPILMFGV
jgi:hypothetical protein